MTLINMPAWENTARRLSLIQESRPQPGLIKTLVIWMQAHCFGLVSVSLHRCSDLTQHHAGVKITPAGATVANASRVTASKAISKAMRWRRWDAAYEIFPEKTRSRWASRRAETEAFCSDWLRNRTGSLIRSLSGVPDTTGSRQSEREYALTVVCVCVCEEMPGRTAAETHIYM